MKSFNLPIVLLLLVLCSTESSVAQTPSIPLRERKVTITLKDAPLSHVFGFLIEKYDVAIGLVGSSLDDNHQDFVFNPNVAIKDSLALGELVMKTEKHRLTLDFRDANLEVVLDEIVRQMNNYRWEVADEVVNILPVKGSHARLEEFLNLKIARFDLRAKAILAIRWDVINLPEITEYQSKNNVVVPKESLYWVHNQRGLKTEKEFSDLTLRELLNGITRIKRGGWLLRMDFIDPDYRRDHILLLF